MADNDDDLIVMMLASAAAGHMTCCTRLMDFVVIHYESQLLIVEDMDSVKAKACS